MGTVFNEFIRCLPDSVVWTNWASRNTSRCFITPKRVKCGNDSTISVVVRGPSRSKSRIARRVGSDSAFQTMSSSSGIRAGPGTSLLAVLSYPGKQVFPALANAFAVFRVDHAERTVPQRHFGASRYLLDLNFQMVVCRIRHKHRAAQFEQGRRLDD